MGSSSFRCFELHKIFILCHSSCYCLSHFGCIELFSISSCWQSFLQFPFTSNDWGFSTSTKYIKLSNSAPLFWSKYFCANILTPEKYFLVFWVVRNGGYPGTDLNIGQNSKSKIRVFFYFTFLIFCRRFKSVPGSLISHYYLILPVLIINNFYGFEISFYNQ